MDQESDAVTPNALDRPRGSWSQESMLPPSEVSLRLDITLDGPAGFATVALVVTHNDERALEAMTCAPVVPYDEALAVASSMLQEQLSIALAVLSPF